MALPLASSAHAWPKRVRLTSGLLLTLVSIALTLGLLELALRRVQRSFPTNLVPTQYSETVGIVNWPGYSGCFNLEGFSCYSINSHGWRDQEHGLSKPEGVYRIAVIGDSFVEALQVDLSQTFWKLLERDLRSEGKNVEVLGFGMSGFDVAQYFETLKHEAIQYQPDLVIVAFFSGNDVRDSVRSLNNIPWKPYYTLNPDGSLALDESFVSYVRAQNTPVNQLFRTVRNSSVLATLGERGMRSMLSRLRSRAATSANTADSGAGRGEFTPEPGLSGSEIFSAPAPGSAYDTAWRVNEKLLVSMRSFAEDHGAKLLILGVSNDDDTYAKAQSAGLDVFYPEERLTQLAAANNLDYLPEAYEEQRVREQTGRRFHGFGAGLGSGHWNEAGHALAAASIERYLASHQIIR